MPVAVSVRAGVGRRLVATLISALALSAMSAAQAAESVPAAATSFAQRQKLALRGATLNRNPVPRFEKLELTFDLAATYDNPFDPAEVLVEASFTSPQGKSFVVSGFLDQAFSRKLDNGVEGIAPAGEPVWKVRFAPDLEGTWRYRVSVRDRSGSVTLPEATFIVTASTNPGFVRRSARNPAAFAFAGERPFFAVGENMGWAGRRGSFDYDDWLAALGKAGGNWMRLWMSNWNCGLEWSTEAKGDQRGGYHGAGVYRLDNAWKLDTILDAAERSGVYSMVCFGTYGELSSGGFFNEGQWKANPYNVANGGPCAKPEEFWTNEQARRLYRQRLRYIMARYAWRTGIHSWEFWNEAHAPAAWIGEMARYLKGTGEFAGHPADPYGHLVTTTYGDAAVWKLPELDFTQSHNYGTGNIADHAPVVYQDARQLAAFNKPHLMGEFGIDWRASDAKYDPDGLGINFHNGLWASAVAGNAGGAMLWWWDNYVHPKNLYAPLGTLRRFAATVPWTEGLWQPLAIDATRGTSGPETWTDLALLPGGGWGKSAISAFTVGPAGLREQALIPQYLYSPGKAGLRTTPAFHVNFAQPGKFVVRVDEVSDRVQLRFLLDGQLAREVTLNATPPADPKVQPEYEQTELRPQYQNYQARFNKDYGIDVPAGEHTVTLDVATGDWLTLSAVTLTGYRSSRYPDVNIYGLTNGHSAILWAQNALHNWKNVADKKPIPVLDGLQATLHGLPPGSYRVEWWDTERGVVQRREPARATADGLLLHLPALATDVAARLDPQ